MRKLVLKMSLSADGFMCGPHHEVDWLFRTSAQASLDYVEGILWQAGLHIMGSRTFHDMASYWPTSSGQLAAPMNEIPKAVFSKKGIMISAKTNLTTQAIKDATYADAEKGISKTAIAQMDTWLNVPVYRDLVTDIAKLKAQDGKFILAHGGASFAQALVKHRLIDEYRLVIHPVVLGRGIPLFAEVIQPMYLKLQNSTTLANGAVVQTYAPLQEQDNVQ